jgi:hypothetical protein
VVLVVEVSVEVHQEDLAVASAVAVSQVVALAEVGSLKLNSKTLSFR